MFEEDFLYESVPPGHKTVIEALAAHHRLTATHSLNVARITKEFLETLNLPEEDVKKAYLAALVHDAGKLGVNPELLDKRGLTAPEIMTLNSHTVNGEYYLKNKDLEGITDFDIVVAKLHHRDSATLPYLIRAIQICDVYSALTEERAYRITSTSTHEAIGIMFNNKRQAYLDKNLLFKFADYVNQKENEIWDFDESIDLDDEFDATL